MTPDDYVVGHVRDALAHEGESDVQAADGLEVVNELTVLTTPDPGPAEELA